MVDFFTILGTPTRNGSVRPSPQSQCKFTWFGTTHAKNCDGLDGDILYDEFDAEERSQDTSLQILRDFQKWMGQLSSHTTKFLWSNFIYVDVQRHHLEK